MINAYRWSRKKPRLHRFFTQCLPAGLLLLACHLCHAEAPPPSKASAAPLTWHQAITQTLARNPSLVAFGFQLSAQAGRVQQAETKANPEVSLTLEDALGTGNYSGVKHAETTLGISWVLNSSQRQQRAAAEQAQTSVLEIEQDIQRLDAAAATARLYMNLLALQARRQQALKAIELAAEMVNMINTRVNAGKSPAAEVMRARVDLAQHRLALEDIEHELSVARHQLAAQWGDTDAAFVEVRGDIFTLPQPAGFAELKARFQNNPRLAYFVSTERLEESHIALAKAESRPQWKVSTGIKHSAASDDQALMLGVSVPLSLFDRQQGRIAEARAQMQRSRAERDAERVRLDAAVFALHQGLLHSLHLVKAYRNGILPQLDSASSETRRAYSLGRYSYMEWQSVQRAVLEAHNNLLEASLTAHLKALEIERLTGVALTPPPTLTEAQ